MARFVDWPPADLGPDEDLYAKLLFADGSQKMLAAAAVWIGLLLCWRKHPAESLKHELVQGLICSLIRIPTSVRASEVRGNQLEVTISRIVAQNINSKVQPITSFGWAGILRGMLGDNATFDECLAAYNSHPEVLAHDRTETGSGSISLDARKRTAVKNFLDKCCPEAFDIIASSCHDLPFNIGPFGEGFACNNLCFLGSKAPLEAISATDEVCQPLAREAFIEVPLLTIPTYFGLVFNGCPLP